MDPILENFTRPAEQFTDTFPQTLIKNRAKLDYEDCFAASDVTEKFPNSIRYGAFSPLKAPYLITAVIHRILDRLNHHIVTIACTYFHKYTVSHFVS